LKPLMMPVIAAAMFLASPGSAQELFSTAQAGQGATLYMRQCSACHGGDLEGGAGPALTGPAFHQLAATQHLTARSLLDRVSTTMPMTAPGSLKPDEYAAIIAFVLQRSGYPAGSHALTKDSAGLGDLDLGKGAVAAAPATAMRAASDGVYTAAQSARGKGFYSDTCINCHGGELDGVEDAPPLAGKPFMSKWGGLPVGALHAFIDKNMPPGNGGALGAVSEADIVAYILSKNNFPAGSNALPADPQSLAGISIK
jgi:mono/diheme cytochrome c family protein